MTGILDEVLTHLKGDKNTWEVIAHSNYLDIATKEEIRTRAKEEAESDLQLIKKIEQFKESLKEW